MDISWSQYCRRMSHYSDTKLIWGTHDKNHPISSIRWESCSWRLVRVIKDNNEIHAFSLIALVNLNYYHVGRAPIMCEIVCKRGQGNIITSSLSSLQCTHYMITSHNDDNHCFQLHHFTRHYPNCKLCKPNCIICLCSCF